MTTNEDWLDVSELHAGLPASESPSEPEAPSVEFDDTGHSTGVEAEDVGERSRDPFDPEKIEVQPRNITISLVLQRLRRQALDLAPDFQRRSGIWNATAQSRLIESVLLRIALPTLYAAERDDEAWDVVDGVQRLTAIARFVDPDAIGGKELRLSNLEYLDRYNGCSFHDLPGRLQTRILETELVILLIRQGTPEAAKFNIFARINTGGLPLSPQELRHALIPGRARDLIAELAESKEFEVATGNSVSPDRMSDREMCLRFLAFALTPHEQYDAQNFDEFLRATMHRINKLSDREVTDLQIKFSLGMIASYLIFKHHAFRKQTGASRRAPVNKALFEAEAVNLAALDNADLKKLMERHEVVMDRFRTLMDDPQFFDSISSGTGDPDKVNYRFQSIKDLLRGVLDA
ncbi:DUF262 domain-containing protein [Kitasatospora sp. NPDC048239]|uniref:DUF262 domain-containing protein n=1 Tax=Kitasatospora sp. NPDC048239 TaxID=3364046 RepID=UPI003721955F